MAESLHSVQVWAGLVPGPHRRVNRLLVGLRAILARPYT